MIGMFPFEINIGVCMAVEEKMEGWDEKEGAQLSGSGPRRHMTFPSEERG